MKYVTTWNHSTDNLGSLLSVHSFRIIVMMIQKIFKKIEKKFNEKFGKWFVSIVQGRKITLWCVLIEIYIRYVCGRFLQSWNLKIWVDVYLSTTFDFEKIQQDWKMIHYISNNFSGMYYVSGTPTWASRTLEKVRLLHFYHCFFVCLVPYLF